MSKRHSVLRCALLTCGLHVNGFRSLLLTCSKVPQRYPQMDMYNDCLGHHGPRHSYLAFIDVDEVRRLPQTIGG